jgi:inner membrane protein
MDNVCHTLVGAALAETGLKHRTRYGAVALMVAANLPDVDVLVFATSTPSVAFRRGWTHGILAQLLLPLVLAGALWAWNRWPGARSPEPGAQSSKPPLRFWSLVGFGYVGVYSHVFLDYLNNYGVRLLNPIDWRWLYGDAVFIVDPWLWITLAIGVWLARRRGHPRPALVALSVAVLYIAGMLALAHDARRHVLGEWETRSGRPPQGLMVGPVPIVPWTREVIIDVGDAYRTGLYTLWPRRLQLGDEVIPKNDRLAEVSVAREAPRVAAFLVWARFPFWETARSPDGTVVTVRDVRFRQRVAGGFNASAVIPSTTSER